MNKQLTILMTGLLAAHTIVLAPAQAQTQTEIKFYCGKSYDPVGRKNIPTTLVSIPNREKPLAVIAWKSEYFPEHAPQQRCDIVSPKFQAAYTAGRLEYLVVSTDKGAKSQIVCGVANQNESCDSKTNMLFTLKPYNDSESVLKSLVGNIIGEAGGPVLQSGDRQGESPARRNGLHRAGNREVLDLGNLLKTRK